MDLEFIRPSEETYRANLFWQICDPDLPDDTPTDELVRILDEIFIEETYFHIDENFYGDF
tara:strand:- start:1321 stop:1500 length:180 start_codon:yes stop_codon:yes gene_type:complete